MHSDSQGTGYIHIRRSTDVNFQCRHVRCIEQASLINGGREEESHRICRIVIGGVVE